MVYISFGGMARDNNNNIKDKSIEYWIESTAKKYRYKITSLNAGGGRYYVAGVWLLPEDATVLRLKFKRGE